MSVVAIISTYLIFFIRLSFKKINGYLSQSISTGFKRTADFEKFSTKRMSEYEFMLFGFRIRGKSNIYHINNSKIIFYNIISTSKSTIVLSNRCCCARTHNSEFYRNASSASRPIRTFAIIAHNSYTLFVKWISKYPVVKQSSSATFLASLSPLSTDKLAFL